MNLVDIFEEGRFLGSMTETMAAVFDEVVVLVEGAWDVRPADDGNRSQADLGQHRTIRVEGVKSLRGIVPLEYE